MADKKAAAEIAKAEKRKQREEAMMNGSIPGTIMSMAIPTIVAFLITSIYNLADTFFVSSLGTNATAAVSVNGSLDQMVMMAGSLLSIGANSYIARLLGARQRKRANRVLSASFFSAMILGLVILILGSSFMVPMVRLLGATSTCEQYSIQYATYVLLVAPFMAASFVMNQCLRAEGNALFSMFGMGFGGVLNCILDPIFIFGLGLGVAGASMATAISKMVSFFILLYPYLTGRSMLKIKVKCFKVDKEMVYQVLSIGSTSLFRNLLGVVSAIVLNNIAGSISDSVLAGIGVSTKIMMFPFSIILGFGSGYQPVAGFNWGARQYDRVKECYHFAWKFAITGTVIMGLLIGIFATPLIGLFATADTQMQQIGSLCIRLQCIALPIHAWVAMVNMYCAALGFPKQALILATARQGTCLLPIVFPLAWAAGGTGVASAQALADAITIFLAIPIILHMLKLVDGKARERESDIAAGRSILPAADMEE